MLRHMGSFLYSGVYTLLCKKVGLQAIYESVGAYGGYYGERGRGVLYGCVVVADIKNWGGVCRLGTL
jgi:hypothetical protein